WRGGWTGCAPGGGADSALVTATAAPAVRRAKPVVTTRSSASRPLAMTACVSSCCDTVTGRTATLLSGCTTYTNVPLGPRCTAAVGATTTCLSVWVSSRTLMKPPGQSCNSRLANSALSLIVPVDGST